MMPSPRKVTQWLVDWGQGHTEALDQLLPLIYDELRRLAQRYLRRERPYHTLQATALVHEAYLRLIDEKNVRWQDRAHFIGCAAQVMRHILVDYARGQHAAKRGGAALQLTLEGVVDVAGPPRAVSFVALDDALTRLAAVDPQQSRIVELRFFGGLTVEETAEVLGISPNTVKYEWRLAKAWFLRELKK